MFLTVFFIAGVLAIAAYAFRASLVPVLSWLRSRLPGRATVAPVAPPTVPPSPTLPDKRP